MKIDAKVKKVFLYALAVNLVLALIIMIPAVQSTLIFRVVSLVLAGPSLAVSIYFNWLDTWVDNTWWFKTFIVVTVLLFWPFVIAAVAEIIRRIQGRRS